MTPADSTAYDQFWAAVEDPAPPPAASDPADAYAAFAAAED